MSKGTEQHQRLRVLVRGAVQGVGFRPFIYRLAIGLQLQGWVNNSNQGVRIEVEGPRAALETFLCSIQPQRPPRSHIHSLEASWLDPVGLAGFTIRASADEGPARTLVLPDIATCPACLAEIFDPANRRHFYPFTNCTQCGPRFSIIEALPYDRANTTMRRFTMCPACAAEYEDPLNRRFHAQPNACPVCGPRLRLWDALGADLVPVDTPESDRQCLEQAARALREGRLVAVKGIGGFHLMADATNAAAVRELRRRKRREEKPFAVMYPDLLALRTACAVSASQERLLTSPEAPIVLLQRLSGSIPEAPVPDVAPGNPWLGVMLPYSPLHHLLLSLVGKPVVATSGNLSDEPICTDEQEALVRLRGLADLFLVHNRPIARHVDDSVARIVLGREMILRRARGYAPLPVELTGTEPEATCVLAVGAHLKNTVALGIGPEVFLSQHIGDLDTEQADAAFRRVIPDLEQLLEARPAIVACDAHPDYASTRFAQALTARSTGGPPPRLVTVQHHVAHVLGCLAENEVTGPALGVAWDGTGYGLDGTVWGGEFFHVNGSRCDRVAHWRTFPLPGGDAAVKEPRRTALGLLYEAFGPAAFEMRELPTLESFSGSELTALRPMLERGLRSPRTSSAGRLFDAVASLLGVRQRVAFEGQAAMGLEFAAAAAGGSGAAGLPCPVITSLGIDSQPFLEFLLRERRAGTAPGILASAFHEYLAEVIVLVARRVGEEKVALSGGCFQNVYLLTLAVERLRAAGFQPYWQQRVPPNDGGIALGQVLAARLGG